MKKFTVLLLAVALILSGCTAYSYAPQDNIFTPATYISNGKGHNGNVKVATTFSKSRITKIKVLEHEESASVGDVAMQDTADAIIAKQGFDVDIISEATYSCVALLEAVSKAAKAAGADVEIITMANVPKAAPVEEDAPAMPEPPYKAGTYTASAKGFGGQVTVNVELSEDKIVSVSAEGPDETDGIGTPALAEMPGKITAANSVDVDATSGATVTSKAIKAAVIDAMNQAK